MHIQIGQWVKTNGEERPLPGLGFTGRQLFWMGFARFWCSKKSDKMLKKQMKRDVHSIEKYRIIGTLQNSEYFSKDFDCKPGSKMNPEKKCILW